MQTLAPGILACEFVGSVMAIPAIQTKLPYMKLMIVVNGLFGLISNSGVFWGGVVGYSSDNCTTNHTKRND